MLTSNENFSTKLQGIVLDPNTGVSFWMPNNSGYITINISPWNVMDTNHTVFLHELPPGGKVSLHSHEQDIEIFVCLSGNGIMTIESETFELSAEKIAYVGKNTMHSIQTVGDAPLRFIVIVSPSGLEERFKLMGRFRQPGEATPPSFISAAPQESHGVKRPKESR